MDGWLRALSDHPVNNQDQTCCSSKSPEQVRNPLQCLGQLEPSVSSLCHPHLPFPAIHTGPISPGHSQLPPSQPAKAISVITGGHEVQTKMSIFIWKNGPILGAKGIFSSLKETPTVESLLPKDLQISGQRKVPIVAGASEKINKGHQCFPLCLHSKALGPIWKILTIAFTFCTFITGFGVFMDLLTRQCPLIFPAACQPGSHSGYITPQTGACSWSFKRKMEMR